MRHDKKIRMAMAAALIGGMAATAQGAQDAKAEPTDRARAIAMTTGGLIRTQPKGRLAVLVSQDRYPDEALTNLISIYSRQLHFPVELRKPSAGFRSEDAVRLMSEEKADVAIFLTQSETLPMSLVALEERWGMVNVAKVHDAKADAKRNRLRLQREMSRVFKALLTSGSTARGAKSVRTARDLDAIARDPIDAKSLHDIVCGLPSFGLTPASITTYQRACEEGWASAPTNEYQRAIWDKVHAAPTKPIVIKPETKKQ